jgi:hypothetical protein
MTRCCYRCRVRISGQSGPFCLTCNAKNLNRIRMATGAIKTCPYCEGTRVQPWGRHDPCDYCEDPSCI